MLLAEYKLNLNLLKVIYFLIKTIKSKHKLTDLNYNRLAILPKIIQIGVLDYGTPSLTMLIMGLVISIGILSEKFVCIFLCIYFVPFALIHVITFGCWIIINSILFSYYKLRFDRIHSSIESIVLNGCI